MSFNNSFKCLLVMGTFLSRAALLANFGIEDCSSALLNQPCRLENAQQQVNCLSSRINKIKSCNAKVANYEQKLQDRVVKKVEEKGLSLVNHLKKIKANHLEKMKEFENIMKWHDANVQGVAKEYAGFVEEFQESYKKSETHVQSKMKDYSRFIAGVKNYLDLINLRFDVKTLKHQEDSQANRFIMLSTRRIQELQAVENFIQLKMSEYSDYLGGYVTSFRIPTYKQEIEFARGVAEYSQQRKAKIGDEVRKICQRIDADLMELEKGKLKRDKDIAFKDGKHIERERSFLNQVNSFVNNALVKVEPLGFSDYEYLGARYRAIKQLLTLDSVCRPENTNRPANEWLVWGCERYAEVREIAKKREVVELPSIIKATLSQIKSERPEFHIKERVAIIENLDEGNLERAVAQYDQLLGDCSRNGGQQ